MNSEHRQSFEDDLFEYFRTMNDEGASINPFTYINKDGDTVDELDDRGLFMDEDNKQYSSIEFGQLFCTDCFVDENDGVKYI